MHTRQPLAGTCFPALGARRAAIPEGMAALLLRNEKIRPYTVQNSSVVEMNLIGTSGTMGLSHSAK